MYTGQQSSAGTYVTLAGLFPGSFEVLPGSICPEDGVEAGFYGFAGGYLSYYTSNPDPTIAINPYDFSIDTPISTITYKTSSMEGSPIYKCSGSLAETS